jgi:hypothetical protein
MNDVAMWEYKVMPVKDIEVSPYNPRIKLKPEDKEYQDIRESLVNFGLSQCLVVNKRTGWLVGGEQRLKILKDMGQKEIPVMVVDLSEDEEKELNLALNEVKGRYDTVKLKTMLNDIRRRKGRLPVGFDDTKYNSVMQEFKNTKKADFLDDVIDESHEEAQRESAELMQELENSTNFDLSEEYVVLSFTLSPDVRERIVSSLKTIQEKYSLANQVEAMVHISKIYLS